LVIATAWAVRPLALHWPRTVAVTALLILGVAAYGTHQRNHIWSSDELLWQDVTVKSPQNGRGLMNYGLSQMSKGEVGVALTYFQRAQQFVPNYAPLEVNLGIVLGIMGQTSEAEGHYKRALQLAPTQSTPYLFYGRWLRSQKRLPEADQMLSTA